MWQQNVSKILSGLGWGSGFRLPISNAENVALERELEMKQRLVTERRTELDDVVKHTAILEKGIKSATDHIAFQSKLIRAKHGETEAEKEFQKLSLRELQKTLKDYQKTSEKFEQNKVENEAILVNVEDRKRMLSELVEIIEYDRKELVRLEEISKDQDKYMHMLEELCEADTETLKKCQARYRSAGGTVALARMELDKTISFTKVAQHQFDGLCERFRKLHDERSEIVHLWKNTLFSLRSRDTDMKELAEEYTQVHKELKSKDVELEAINVKLETMSKETNSSEYALNRWDRKVGDLRTIIKETQSLTEEYQDSAIAYGTSISLGTQAMKDLKTKASDIDEELAGMLKKLAAAEANVAELTARADISKMEALTATEKMKQISVMIEEEEKKMEELGKVMEKEMTRKSRWSATKSSLIKEALSLDHEIKGVSTNLNQLLHQCNEADITLETRKQMIYRFDIQFIALDCKFKAASNPRVFNPQTYEILEDKIAELKKALQDIIHNRSFLKVQTGHLDDVNRRIYREKTISVKELKNMEEAISGCRVDIRFSTKSLEELEVEFCDGLVEKSMVKLRLNQMLRSVKEHKSLLYDAGHQRVLLESAVKEKRMEIENHSKLLQAKIRGMREELSQYKIQLSETADSIYKRKNKYEIVMRMLDKPEYGDGNIQSEAYYVLRLAQEREELRREGDRWDTLVKEAEKETEGLQNSLRLMQCSNELFKDSLKTLPDEAFQSQIDGLESKQREIMKRKQTSAKQMRLLKKEIEDKVSNLKNLQDQMSSYANKLTEKDHEHRILQADMRNQDQTIRRVQHLTYKLLGEIAFSGKEEKDLFQLDIKLNATRRKLELGLTNLAKLLTLFPHLVQDVTTFLCKSFGNNFTIRFLNRINPACSFENGKSSPKSPGPAQYAKTLKSGLHRKGATVKSSLNSASKKSRINQAHQHSRPEHETVLIGKVIDAVEKQRQVELDEKKMDAERLDQVKELKKSLISSNTLISDSNEDPGSESPTAEVVWKPPRTSLGSDESIPSLEHIPPPSTPANEIVKESENIEEEAVTVRTVGTVKEIQQQKTEVSSKTEVVAETKTESASVEGSRKQSPTSLPEGESSSKRV